ncbi:MAG: hypothetical protein IIA87_03525 [Nanoarchaeota archaeon]|nr:hypothetical protein [Nanoarchaeota archaeon]
MNTIIQNIIRRFAMRKVVKKEIIARALFNIGIDLKECYWNQDDDLIIPDKLIQD